MEYIKINDITIDFTNFDIEHVIENSKSFKYYSQDNDQYGLFYFHPRENLIDEIRKSLPKLADEDYTVDLCKIYKGALPHRDHDCSCKLNFYLKSGGAKTLFFSDPIIDEGYSYHNDGKNNMFDIKKHRLKRIGGFSAMDGDVYLLNTTKIHAVSMENLDTRLIVSLSFNKHFDEILKKLS